MYGYSRKPGAPNKPDDFATTAIGHLCRMYMGMSRDHPDLSKGIAILAERGPTNDLYYDYYATQVMHHFGGDMWTAWNAKMKKLLLETQSANGHEAGSWFQGVSSGHGTGPAGRLYCTSLATLILEVYYRHLPLYGNQSVQGKFGD